MSNMKIIAISDTHNQHGTFELPEGDILVHAGDFTNRGKRREVIDFAYWINKLPGFKRKIIIAGNHDFYCQQEPEEMKSLFSKEDGVEYLSDSSIEVDNIKFWGSPWQPWFYDWAFNLPRGPIIAKKWALIPEDVDVLITHGPPYGHGDQTRDGEKVGCEDLLERIKIVQPNLHIFGHIHEGYGLSKEDDIICANASTCNSSYEPVQPPLIIDI